jgi:hypothetical protein
MPAVLIGLAYKQKIPLARDIRVTVGSRTPNLRIRSAMLYPVELR